MHTSLTIRKFEGVPLRALEMWRSTAIAAIRRWPKAMPSALSGEWFEIAECSKITCSRSCLRCGCAPTRRNARIHDRQRHQRLFSL